DSGLYADTLVEEFAVRCNRNRSADVCGNCFIAFDRRADRLLLTCSTGNESRSIGGAEIRMKALPIADCQLPILRKEQSAKSKGAAIFSTYCLSFGLNRQSAIGNRQLVSETS